MFYYLTLFILFVTPSFGFATPINLLVVIDMQPQFPAGYKKETLDAVLQEIDDYKAANQPIYMVLYQDDLYFELMQEVQDRVRDYPLVSYIYKNQDSGTYEVLGRLIQEKVLPDSIRFCGVNTSLCVERTVFGLYLLRFFFPVKKIDLELREKACNDEDYQCHQSSIKFFKFLPWFRVI